MSNQAVPVAPNVVGWSGGAHLGCRCSRRLSVSRAVWRSLPNKRQARDYCQVRSASLPPAQGDDNDQGDLSELPVAKSSEQLRGANNQAEALIRSLEKVSSQQGRSAQTRNVVLGDDHSLDSWRELDKKVNKYPHRRTFKAIGEGGDSFASCMQAAVENVLGPVHPDCVHQRLSNGRGAYISVSIGPVTVQNSEQVIGVYSAMSQDSRLKFYL